MEVLKGYLCSLFLLAVSNAAIFSPEFEKKLDSYIEASRRCHYIPGMTLSVVKGDEVWSRGFGKEDLDTGKVVDPYSIFDIGSVTKSFTATLLGILLSENGLDWTSKVTDILGSEYEFVDSYRTKELMLRDLLSHRTGLARLDFGGLASGIPKSVSRSEFCKRMKYLPEEIPIRDGLIYNNFMFMMLGHVAEVLGNDTWENLVNVRLFQPLGMTNTTILKSPSDVLKPNVARPYIYTDGDFQNSTLEIYDNHPAEPAGNIMSTATDMAKWIKFNLNLGRTESGKQLIDKKLMEDIHSLTTPIDSQGSMTKPDYPVSDIILGYGYGWFLSEYRGYRKVWHSGGLGNYATQLWTFPDMDIGLFASVTGPGFGTHPPYHNSLLFYYIIDHVFGLEPWLNETTVCSFPEPWGNATKVDATLKETPIHVDNPAEFEGFYGNHLFPDIKVYSNTTDLFLNSNRIHGVLHPSSEKDRFVYEITYPWEYSTHTYGIYVNVTFERDVTATIVESLTLHLEVDLQYNKGVSFTQDPSTNPPIIG